MASPKLSQDNFSSNNSHADVSTGNESVAHPEQPVLTSENGVPLMSGKGIQQVKGRVAQEFERARTVERRRYMQPGEIDPESLGRRKNDRAPKSNPRPPLSQLAQPILQQINATGMSSLTHRRNQSAACWDIGDAPEVSDAELPKLLESCEVALGFKKPAERSSMEDEPEKRSIWKRDIFGKAR